MLPPFAVWERVVDQASFRQATLRICIKRRGLFFDRQLASGFHKCILNRQGYLVIYTDMRGEGYALNLRKAEKISLDFEPDAMAPVSASAADIKCKPFFTKTVSFDILLIFSCSNCKIFLL